jgi:hypothetical protein
MFMLRSKVFLIFPSPAAYGVDLSHKGRGEVYYSADLFTSPLVGEVDV